MPDNKKVTIAGMHLEGTCKSWYQVFIIGRTTLIWVNLCTHFAARFGVREHELLHDKFKQLRQGDSLEQYCSQFELLMEQLKLKLPQLTEDYFVECIISGLQEDLRKTIKFLTPTTMESALK